MERKMIYSTWIPTRELLPDQLRVILCLAAIWVTLGSTKLSGSDSPCRIHITKPEYEYKYFKDGDIIIGGVFTVHNYVEYNFTGPERYTSLCTLPVFEFFSQIHSFRFAIDEINRNPDLLPNITLGYHIYDSCGDPCLAIGSILQILSGPGNVVPNYSCRGKGEIAGFIGDQSSLTSLPIAQLLGVYGYTQISYGATDPTLNDRNMFPYYFSTGLSDDIQHIAVAELVEQLGWTWVIIVAPDNDSGEKQSQNLQKEINKRGACVEMIILLTDDFYTNMKLFEQIMTAEVIVLCGTPSDLMLLSLSFLQKMAPQKTLVITLTWGLIGYEFKLLYNCSLTFLYPQKRIKGLNDQFNDYLLSVEEDMLLKDILEKYPLCDAPEPFNLTDFSNCTKRTALKDMNIYFTINDEVYRSVYTLVHALRTELSVSVTHRDKYVPINTHRNQLHRYMKNLHFKDPWGEESYYEEFRDILSVYWIINSFYMSDMVITSSLVGTVTFPQSKPKIEIYVERIMWKKDTKNQILKSQCSANCPPGSRKIPGKSAVPCCYACVPCSHGEIS
uniref:Receptor ligand binding region domain-containing protein n=1 Tax=Xenopus tropicalis TaxID=8364 RepID=A0A803JY55_XENTR